MKFELGICPISWTLLVKINQGKGRFIPLVFDKSTSDLSYSNFSSFLYFSLSVFYLNWVCKTYIIIVMSEK